MKADPLVVSTTIAYAFEEALFELREDPEVAAELETNAAMRKWLVDAAYEIALERSADLDERDLKLKMFRQQVEGYLPRALEICAAAQTASREPRASSRKPHHG